MEKSYQEYLDGCVLDGVEQMSEEEWNKSHTEVTEALETPEGETIVDLISEFTNELDVIDYDITWPESIESENSVQVKLVIDEDGDEVEKIIFLKLMIDEEAMAKQQEALDKEEGE